MPAPPHARPLPPTPTGRSPHERRVAPAGPHPGHRPHPGLSAFGFGPDGWPLTERVYTPPTSLGEAIDDFANFLLTFERLRPTTVHNYVT